MSAKDPPIATKAITFADLQRFAAKLRGNGFGDWPVPIQVIEPIKWTPELEKAWGKGGRLIDIPEPHMWKSRRQWIRVEAERFWHNSDPWTALYMAAVTWERFYAST